MTMVFGTPAPCLVCGSARSRHDAVKGSSCSSLKCQTALLEDEKRKANEAYDQKCKSYALDFAESHGTDDHIAARVPFLDRPVVKTPDDRKSEFRRNFRESMRETNEDARTGALATVHPYEDGESTPVLDTSCIACRGFCCRQGAGHAFLNRTYLPSILGRRPEDSPAKIYRDYVHRIPEEAVENSCVYQGANGCVLPRTMRADICNDYECDGRQALRRALTGQTASGAVVVAMDGETIKSAAVAKPGAALDWLKVPAHD